MQPAHAEPDPVLALVRVACSAPENRFGPEFLDEHLLVVERFAGILAGTLDADREAVRVAALLHDLAAIRDWSVTPRHAEAGAELATKLLSPGGELAGVRFDAARIERVATCAREHSSPKVIGRAIPESVAVSNADAMAQIARPLYWFHYARTVRNLCHADAMAWYRSLIERNWNALIDAARPLIEAEHAAAALVVR